MQIKIRALLFLVFLNAGGAWAHHSYAPFDSTRTLEVTGIVKEWAWTNPHVRLKLMVEDSSGAQVEYDFVTASPSILRKIGGVTRNFIKEGDTATAIYFPKKDGSPGGALNWLNGVVAAPGLPDSP